MGSNVCKVEESDSDDASSETGFDSDDSLIAAEDAMDQQMQGKTAGLWSVCGSEEEDTPERKTRGLKVDGQADKHHPFRAIPFARCTKKSLKGPLMFFNKSGTDKAGDPGHPWERDYEGKRQDFQLSEPVDPKKTKVLFYSHTRSRLPERMDTKLKGLMKALKDKEYKDCTHLWIDGACFNQCAIIDGEADVTYADLKHAIKNSHKMVIDEDLDNMDYWQKEWCVLEAAMFCKFKGDGNVPYEVGYKNALGMHELERKKMTEAWSGRVKSKKQKKQIVQMILDAHKDGLTRTAGAMKKVYDAAKSAKK